MTTQDISSEANSTVLAPAQARTAERTGASLLDLETLGLGLVLSVALVTHAFNMFNFPLYRQDEGILTQDAWSFLHNWQLSPYTYTYEHPPFATFMLAAWTFATGGFHTFGGAINSGRVLMLLLQVVSSFLLFKAARQLIGSVEGAVIAGLLFNLSPLAVNYQRLVVTDNFMVFWLLVAFYFTICNRGKMFNFFAASAALGLAIMSRETAIVFVPAFVFLYWRFSDTYHRRFAVAGTIMLGSTITIQFLLYAIFKGELWPENWDFAAELAGKASHVSLLGTLYQKYSNSAPIWNGNADFNSFWQVWTGMDSLLLFAGAGCALLNLLFGFTKKENWVVPVLGVSFGAFMVLGGMDADYMLVTLVPFLALAIGHFLGRLSRLGGPMVGFLITVTVVVVAGYFYITNNQAVYTSDANSPYTQALNWIKSNIPSNHSLIITDALWVDLQDSYNGPAFPLAHSHWKAATDPAVRVGIFNGDYNNVDYLIVTTEMRDQFKQKGEAFPQQVLDNSSLVRQFDGKDAIEVRKVNNGKALIENNTLEDAYNFYKSKFISQDGKVADAKGKTTADYQAASLLMALWSNDQKTFDTVWTWTAFNLQQDNNLFRSDLTANPSRSRIATENYTNTRADTDIALALLLAGRRWKDDSYSKEALYIIRSIWGYEVVEVNNKYYPRASAAPEALQDDEVLLNLGAFSPHAYKLFAEIDKDHDWMALYNNGYELLQKASWYGRGDYKGLGLPPGLVVMNRDTEELRSPTGTYGTRLSDFDEEAQQAVWRVTLDYSWNHSEKARDFIQGSGWFLIKFWKKWDYLPSQFTGNGLPVNGPQTLSSYAVASSGAAVLNQIDLENKRARGENAKLTGANNEVEIIARAFMGSFYRKDDTGYWLKDDNLNAQEWGWFGTAFHMQKLTPNFTQPAPQQEVAGLDQQ